MQISSRFTIGTHVLIMIALQGEKTKLTSDFLAGSVGVNPVIIRKTLSQLKKAGLIHVARGTGGAELAKAADEISLLDIIESPPVDIVEEYSTRQDIRFLFSSMKDILTPKEYQVICCRYGLFENNEMTQREIADQLHISRSYVSRIEKNALKKLKTLFG